MSTYQSKMGRILKKEEENILDRTRSTLIHRLKDGQDNESWREAFDMYWPFIFSAAKRKGLSQSDAEDVTQEAIIRVTKAMPKFEYNRARGSYKGWLLQILRNAISDHFRKVKGTNVNIDDIEEQSNDPELQEIWDEEWAKNLMDLALKQTRNKVSKRDYQIFHLHTQAGHSVKETSKIAGVSAARVYVVKSRVGRVFKGCYSDLKRGE